MSAGLPPPALPGLHADQLEGYAIACEEAQALVSALPAFAAGLVLGDRAAIARGLLANTREAEGEAGAEGEAVVEGDPGAEEEAVVEGDPGAEGEDLADAAADAPPATAPEVATSPFLRVVGDGSPWTTARLALLDALFPSVASIAEILARLNALPGELPVASEGALAQRARKRGLSRRGVPDPGVRDPVVPDPVVPDRGLAPPAPDARPDRILQLGEDDLAEARAWLARGKGALDLAEYFGGELALWQAWCAAERAALAAGAGR